MLLSTKASSLCLARTFCVRNYVSLFAQEGVFVWFWYVKIVIIVFGKISLHNYVIGKQSLNALSNNSKQSCHIL